MSEAAWNGQPWKCKARREAVIVDGSLDCGAVVVNSLRWTVTLPPVVQGVAHDGQERRGRIVALQRADVLGCVHAPIPNNAAGRYQLLAQ